MNKLLACSILILLTSGSSAVMACSMPTSSDSESEKKAKLEACKDSAKSKTSEKKTTSSEDGKTKFTEKKDEFSQKFESKRSDSSKSTK